MQREVQYIIMQDLFNGRSQWLTFYGNYDKPHASLLNLKTCIDPHASNYPQKNSTLRFHHFKWRISTVICFLDYRHVRVQTFGRFVLNLLGYLKPSNDPWSRFLAKYQNWALMSERMNMSLYIQVRFWLHHQRCLPHYSQGLKLSRIFFLREIITIPHYIVGPIWKVKV